MAELILSKTEQAQLQFLIRTTPDGRLLRRADALQRVSEGEEILAIADDLDVTRQSIYNWVAHFVATAGQPLETRLADAARSGRPKTALGVIDPLIDAVLDEAPETWGYAAITWTAPLLAQYLADQHHQSVSVPSVRLALARLRQRWKRPRHALALRPRYWRQAKGGLNAGYLAENAP
jgi:transposase